MKKQVTILLPIILATSCILFGCGKDKTTTSKTMLTFGDIKISNEDIYDLGKSYKYDIDLTTLENKITKKNENFMLVVAQRGCYCWTNLASVIEQYMNETHAICYRIETSELLEAHKTFGLTISSGNSTFAIFENGVIKTNLCTSDNLKELKDYSSFKNMVNNLIDLPKMFFIDETTLNESLLDNPHNKATVYFGRSKCGDCQNVEPAILKPYFETHTSSNPLYILDCQEFWAASGSEGFENYQTKKDDFLLSEVNNPKYGYGTGVFPTFLYIEEADAKSGAVAYNDTLSKVNDKYVVTNSYYTEERKTNLQYLNNFSGTSVIKGLEIKEENLSINQYYTSWDYNDADKYYKPLIGAFLDYSLEKTNLFF